MRYAIDYDEDRDCFIYQKIKSSKSSEHFKTRRLVKKYVSKLNKEASLLREVAMNIELPATNHFDGSIVYEEGSFDSEVLIEGQLDVKVSE